MIETVYLGHDNSFDLLFKENDVAYSLATVTKITITVGTVTITSDNGDADPIRWYRAGYDTGEARFFLGDQAITEGTYRRCYIVIYDYDHKDGLVWGSVYLKVKAEVEV